MKVECPLGDIVDRATILELKAQRIVDPRMASHAARERAALVDAWQTDGQPDMSSLPSYSPLARVNARLWDIEEALRAHEDRGDFGDSFVALARQVYTLNDERARLKAEINRALRSDLVEVKSYRSQRASAHTDTSTNP